jgi:hypothetical protein
MRKVILSLGISLDSYIARSSQETCEYSKLTPAETKTLADAEQKRNYTACVKGYGYCDRTRLTPSQAWCRLQDCAHGRHLRFDPLRMR